MLQFLRKIKLNMIFLVENMFIFVLNAELQCSIHSRVYAGWAYGYYFFAFDITIFSFVQLEG